jgi:hypothetical protein
MSTSETLSLTEDATAPRLAERERAASFSRLGHCRSGFTFGADTACRLQTPTTLCARPLRARQPRDSMTSAADVVEGALFRRVVSDNRATTGHTPGCVTQPCHGVTVTTGYPLHGLDLRYVLTMYPWQHGPATGEELIDAIRWQGFDVGGRASKQVSDALRGERRRGRVRRRARGLCAPGVAPHTTAGRIHQRVIALRAAAKPLDIGGTEL